MSVKVQVDKDRVLTISGQRQKSSITPQPPNAVAEQEGHSHRQERRFGRFKRFWDLPKDADVSQINASVEQGVLNVIIKKKRPEERDIMDIPVY